LMALRRLRWLLASEANWCLLLRGLVSKSFTSARAGLFLILCSVAIFSVAPKPINAIADAIIPIDFFITLWYLEFMICDFCFVFLCFEHLICKGNHYQNRC